MLFVRLLLLADSTDYVLHCTFVSVSKKHKSSLCKHNAAAKLLFAYL